MSRPAPVQTEDSPLGNLMPPVILETPAGEKVALADRIRGRPALLFVHGAAECASCSKLALEMRIARNEVLDLQPLRCCSSLQVGALCSSTPGPRQTLSNIQWVSYCETFAVYSNQTRLPPRRSSAGLSLWLSVSLNARTARHGRLHCDRRSASRVLSLEQDPFNPLASVRAPLSSKCSASAVMPQHWSHARFLTSSQWRGIAAGIVSLLFISCDRESEGQSEIVRRDSADVEIVENLVSDHLVPTWRLDSVMVSIGTVEGEEAQQLHQVRGALLLGSQLVVLNAGSSELRFFGRTGRHVKTVGGEGEGPGEFRSGYWLGRHRGDSIAVYDFGLRRLTVFDSTGAFGRISRRGYRDGQIVGRLADGRFVVRPAIATGRPEDVRPGMVRDPLPILLVSPDREDLDTLATYPAQELEREVTGPAGSERVSLRIRPFGLSSHVGAGDSVIYAGTGDRCLGCRGALNPFLPPSHRAPTDRERRD